MIEGVYYRRAIFGDVNADSERAVGNRSCKSYNIDYRYLVDIRVFYWLFDGGGSYS
jgi:hypothetical protein